ncbi:MAG: PTS sugar transporter subunit IIA [Kiritimatiellia bacterium]|nr:PTS sugar transporter subunit IIA [Kiritimatiellia bacterium]
MQSLLNHLRQLQDLVLIRDEHRAAGDGSHMERLNDSIDALTDKLPPDVRSLYMRLYKKDHVVIAPVYNGSCTICGMRLPISQLQAVRLNKELQSCPSCARILCEEPDAPHSISEVPETRPSPRKPGISRFSAECLMLPQMDVSSRDEAIARLSNLMERTGFVKGADKLTTLALEREAVLSTAIEYGIAFPHVRGVEGGGLTLALGVTREPIVWGDAEEKVRIILFITIPTAVSAFYLRLMSGLTESLLKNANREALLNAETPEQLWKALVKATRYTIR